YYSRMSALTNAVLISRSNGKYFLTSFGKVVYEAQLLIEKAKQNYWKLRAIDSIESSLVFNGHRLPVEERDRIIGTLMEGNDEIKQILLGNYDSGNGKNAPQTKETEASLLTAL